MAKREKVRPGALEMWLWVCTHFWVHGIKFFVEMALQEVRHSHMLKQLRIAMLADPLSVGLRGGRHAAELAVALGQSGFDVRLFGAAKDLERARESRNAPSARTLGAQVLSFRPDVVVAYDSLSPVAWLGTKLSRRANVPLVLIEAGDLDEAEWSQRSLKRVGAWMWGRAVRKCARAVIALDDQIRERLQLEGFASETLFVVPHGVERARFAEIRSSPLYARHAVKGRILLAPATRQSSAGLEVLIQAFSRSLGQRPDWTLAIAGSGSPSMDLIACAQRMGIGANVHLLTASEEDWPALYGSATLVAIVGEAPSATRVALARACAAGKGILASDLPEHRAWIQERSLGLLAPADSLTAWAANLEVAARDPQLRSAWSERASQVGLELDWRQVAARFQEIFQGALELQAASAPRRSTGERSMDQGASEAAQEKARTA